MIAVKWPDMPFRYLCYLLICKLAEVVQSRQLVGGCSKPQFLLHSSTMITSIGAHADDK